MEINRKADIRLIGRAIAEGWQTTQEKKNEALDALMDVIRLRDPELTIEAVKVLVKIDEANIKHAALEDKRQNAEYDRKLRLLEIARHLPTGELSKLTSGNAGSSSST